MTITIEGTPAQGSFTLTAGIMHALRTEAARTGLSISELARQILEEGLKQRGALV